MKLNEITRIAEYEPNASKLLSVLKSTNRRQIDTFENRPVYMTPVGDQIVYDVDGKALVVGSTTQVATLSVFKIRYTYVVDEFRQKGFATILYKCLAMSQRLNIVSDSLMTHGSIKLWAGLIKSSSNIKRLNLTTQEITDIQSIQSVINNDDDVVLIWINSGRPKIPSSDIVEQAVHYTSKDQEGLWE